MMFKNFRELLEMYDRAKRSQSEARKAGHEQDAEYYREQALFLEKRLDDRLEDTKNELK